MFIDQRGFINVGVLVALLVGFLVLGGGAYYVVQLQSPSSTPAEGNIDNPSVSTEGAQPILTVIQPTPQPISSNQPTDAAKTTGISGTVDSTTFNVSLPTITGSAKGVSTVGISITSNGVEYYNTGDTIPVQNNKWSHSVVTQDFADGIYNVKLYASAPNNAIGSGTITIEAGVLIGTKVLSVGPPSGAAPLEVMFGGSIELGSYSIDFGDGTSIESDCLDRQACPDPVYMLPHTYRKAGTYTARLIKYGPTGSQVLGSVTVKVLSSAD